MGSISAITLSYSTPIRGLVPKNSKDPPAKRSSRVPRTKSDSPLDEGIRGVHLPDHPAVTEEPLRGRRTHEEGTVQIRPKAVPVLGGIGLVRRPEHDGTCAVGQRLGRRAPLLYAGLDG